MLQDEIRIQSDMFQWFHNTYPEHRGLLYHVPNGEKRDVLTANRLKGAGVVAGVPDLVFHFKARTWFFEVKTPTGIVSKVQGSIHDIMKEQGFIVFIVRDLLDFQNKMKAIISQEWRHPFDRSLSREDWEYKVKVYNYFYNILIHNEIVSIETLTSPASRLKFTEVAKEFISLGYPQSSGFEMLFTNDFEALSKFVDGQPRSPVMWKGQTQVTIKS